MRKCLENFFFSVISKIFSSDIIQIPEDVLKDVADSGIIPSGDWKSSSDYEMGWNDYHGYDVIMDFMDSLAEQYPEHVEVMSAGTSFEGRDMKVLKVGRGGPGTPTVFIEGGERSNSLLIVPVKVK